MIKCRNITIRYVYLELINVMLKVESKLKIFLRQLSKDYSLNSRLEGMSGLKMVPRVTYGKYG